MTEKELVRQLTKIYKNKKTRPIIFRIAEELGYSTTQAVVHWVSRKSIPSRKLETIQKIIERHMH